MGRFDSYGTALYVGAGYSMAMKRRGACGEIAISQDIPDLVYYMQAIEALGDRFFLSANAEERADLRVEISSLVSRMVQFCEAYNLCKLKPVDRSKYYDPMPEYLRIQGEELARVSLEVANV
jgi:hypothetical protein